MTAHSKEKRISIATVRDHYSTLTIAIPLVCNCTLPVKICLKTFFKILKAIWTGHGPFSIEKILIFNINLSKNLHGAGDQNLDVQQRHFVSSLSRLAGRLRDYAANTYRQFLASALLLHKNYLLFI
jgi:hypothetical protein